MLVTAQQVERALIGMPMPASTEQIVEHVRRAGAQPQLLAVLVNLASRTFSSAADVAREVTGDLQENRGLGTEGA